MKKYNWIFYNSKWKIYNTSFLYYNCYWAYYLGLKRPEFKYDLFAKPLALESRWEAPSMKRESTFTRSPIYNDIIPSFPSVFWTGKIRIKDCILCYDTKSRVNIILRVAALIQLDPLEGLKLIKVGKFLIGNKAYYRLFEVLPVGVLPFGILPILLSRVEVKPIVFPQRIISPDSLSVNNLKYPLHAFGNSAAVSERIRRLVNVTNAGTITPLLMVFYYGWVSHYPLEILPDIYLIIDQQLIPFENEIPMIDVIEVPTDDIEGGDTTLKWMIVGGIALSIIFIYYATTMVSPTSPSE